MDERYEAWNSALAEEYFPAGNAGRLAYLPVDDDELVALAEAYSLGDPASAVTDFIAAVCDELATRQGSFRRFSSGINGWRRVRDVPPYIAGLALCVLAASRMDTDFSAGVSSSNYYTQLNRIIGRGDREGQPPGFDTLQLSWKDLSTWLEKDCQGERGVSTVRTLPHRAHIGYPLRQSLLRACDRRRLPDFFRATGIEPKSEISEDKLFILLRAWAAQPGCGLTNRARDAIATAEDIDRHEIAETVARELAAWDGQLRDPRGRVRGPIHLLVIPRRNGSIVQLLPRRPEGFPDGDWSAEDGRTVRLGESEASEAWYQPLDMRVTDAILSRGLTIRKGNLVLTYEPAAAVPCRQASAEIGGYISQTQVRLWEPHLTVIRRPLLASFAKYAAPLVEDRISERASPDGFPTGWAITTDFRFSSTPGSAPPEFSRLAPRLIASTTLEGGLRLSRDVYLTGGEPDALVTAQEGQALTVELGERAETIRGARRLSLHQWELPPGEHRLGADVTRTFSTIVTFGSPAPEVPDPLGQRFSRHRNYKPETAGPTLLSPRTPAGSVDVRGAVATARREDLPLLDQPPVLLRAGGRRYLLVGVSPGEIYEVTDRSAPSWLDSIGLADFFQFVEARPPFEAAWALVTASAGQLRCVRLGDGLAHGGSNGRDQAAWVAAIEEFLHAEVASEDGRAWEAFANAAMAA